MDEFKLFPLPTRDPVSGGPLYVSELTGAETGVTIRGRFRLPKVAELDADHQRVLDSFLRCRGVLSAMERELGLSYPTIRARVDAMLAAAGYGPQPAETAVPPVAHEVPGGPDRMAILDRLERGEITPAQAKALLAGRTADPATPARETPTDHHDFTTSEGD